MVVLLDTSAVCERQRLDALQAAYEHETPPRMVVVDPTVIRHRVERVELGPEVSLLRARGTSLQISRTDRQVRSDPVEYVALGFHRRGHTLLSSGGVDVDVPVGHLNCVDLTRPYRLTHRDENDHDVLVLANQQAGVSVDTVRAAAPALAGSPVYDLVRRHLAGLFSASRELSTQPRLLTGHATLTLARALLITAAQGRDRDDAMEDALDLRITLYIDAHLTEHTLTPESIAAAHHISLRHLYTTWTRAGHELSLSQWITDRRLRRARDRLATPAFAPATIEAVARACGFTNISHFSRRFREAFATSPREWRAAHPPARARLSDREPATHGKR